MPKLRKIARHVPLILAVTGLGLAVKSAVDYKEELDEIAKRKYLTIEVTPEVMVQVEDGKALIYWLDENQQEHFQVTSNSLIKNL